MVTERSSLHHGMVLDLRTPAGNTVHIRRRGSTALGEFYIREKAGGFYIEFRFFERGACFPKKVYLGKVGGVS